ncbi:hypothetical protein EVAR_40426_1 [Eumeta japonica]|uniref:Uncharacterized protein n=1 Tax=Eumeta variegata TaxID=151549 RepID=A0A4C1SER9_EUMVA|nr:hypothetical protein EVAR_40426_1 [Eumeta japonica]
MLPDLSFFSPAFLFYTTAAFSRLTSQRQSFVRCTLFNSYGRAQWAVTAGICIKGNNRYRPRSAEVAASRDTVGYRLPVNSSAVQAPTLELN